MKRNISIRTCKAGHQYQKSTDCPTCPLCEKQKNQISIWHFIPAPARRALENAGIDTLKKLSKFTESEIAQLHGMGPTTLPKLKSALKAQKLGFKPQKKS